MTQELRKLDQERKNEDYHLNLIQQKERALHERLHVVRQKWNWFEDPTTCNLLDSLKRDSPELWVEIYVVPWMMLMHNKGSQNLLEKCNQEFSLLELRKEIYCQEWEQEGD